MSLKHHRTAFTIRLFLLALIVPLSACKKSDTPTNPEKPSTVVFASPDDAGSAPADSRKGRRPERPARNLWPRFERAHLLRRCRTGQERRQRIRGRIWSNAPLAHHAPDGSQMLLVGADNFSFPIPLEKNADGKWFFDTAAGREEVLNRRIGRNELAIIAVCGAVADAEAEYYSKPHEGEKARQFAAKFISDPGKQNGLYWKVADGQPPSPLGPMAAFATAEGYTAKPEGHTAFHGYYFPHAEGPNRKSPRAAQRTTWSMAE